MGKTSTIEDFNATGKKQVTIRFPCECGEWIEVTADIPKPNIAGDNYSEGSGQVDITVECPCCGKEYSITVQVDPSGTTGTVYIDPAINESQSKLIPLP
jgi:hypothetical protein